MKLVMHSYTFRAYPLETAFARAKAFGWEALELQPCHFNPGAIETELPRALELARQYETPIHCVDFAADLIGDDAGAVERSIAQTERTIAACSEHGIGLINGGVGALYGEPMKFWENGSALAQDIHYERAAQGLRHLADYAKPRGVTIALEIHMNMPHDTVASTARLLDLVQRDNVVANPDPGNIFATCPQERDPAVLERLAGRIGYFHLKNCVEVAGTYSFSVKLGEGHLNYDRWIRKLVELGYEGALCVEYCGEGDPHPAAQADYRYLREVLARCS